MSLAVVPSAPVTKPSIRVALVRTTASCPGAYDEFRRALIDQGLEVSEAGIGSVNETHRRQVAARGGAGWVFVLCRMAANDVVTTRLIQEQLAAAGLSRGDCVVLTPLEGRGNSQAAAVVRKVEMNLRLLDDKPAGPPQPPSPERTTCADSDIRTQVVRPVRLVRSDEGSQSETEMTMPYEVVPNSPTEVYQPVKPERRDPPSRRLSAPGSIGERVMARRPHRGFKAALVVAAVGCLTGVVAWQWDWIGGLVDGQGPVVASQQRQHRELDLSPGETLAPDQADLVGGPPVEVVVPVEGDVPVEPVAPVVMEVPEVEQPTMAAPADDAHLIAAALEAHSIRSLDAVLVDKKRSKRIGYDKAQAWCADRDVDGVTGWRLPEIGELRSLSKRKMVPKGRYWTTNEANMEGSRQVVWDSVKRDLAVGRHDSKRVRAICVRDHVGHRS